MVAREEALQRSAACRILKPRHPPTYRARVVMAAGASLSIGSLADGGTSLLRTGGGRDKQQAHKGQGMERPGLTQFLPSA